MKAHIEWRGRAISSAYPSWPVVYGICEAIDISVFITLTSPTLGPLYLHLLDNYSLQPPTPPFCRTELPPNQPRIVISQLPNMSTDPKYDDLHKELFEEGLKMRRSVVGDEYVDRALANGSTEFSRAGQELVTEWCWGYAWTRPGLSKQQRSLINIGMLMALNRAPELAVHIRGARNNGLSELEIREAIIHATTYCGVPAGVDAMKTAERVLNEMAEKGEKPREMGEKAA